MREIEDGSLLSFPDFSIGVVAARSERRSAVDHGERAGQRSNQLRAGSEWPIASRDVEGVPAPLLFFFGTSERCGSVFGRGKTTTQVQLEYLGGMSNPIVLPVAATAPGVFGTTGSGQGQAAIVNASDGTVNSTLHPSARGNCVSIFATGGGVTTPASVDGIVATAPLPSPNAAVSVTMGGLPCPIEFQGLAPGLVSDVLQINAQVPSGLSPSASVPLQIRIGSVTSPAAVTVAVQLA
jgi:uncharacterized protein (TIGR03437 family)